MVAKARSLDSGSKLDVFCGGAGKEVSWGGNVACDVRCPRSDGWCTEARETSSVDTGQKSNARPQAHLGARETSQQLSGQTMTEPSEPKPNETKSVVVN